MRTVGRNGSDLRQTRVQVHATQAQWMLFPLGPAVSKTRTQWEFKQKRGALYPFCSWNSLPITLPVLKQRQYSPQHTGAPMHACSFSGHKPDSLELCDMVRKWDSGLSVNCCCYESILFPLLQIINIYRTLTTATLTSRAVIYSFPINIHWGWHSFSPGTVIQHF